MSYASECLARGRTLFDSTFEPFLERPFRRWMVLLPVVFGSGFVLMFCCIPWICTDEGGGIGFFAVAFSMVTLAALIAPRRKGVSAVVVALIVIILGNPAFAHPANPDPDAPNLYWSWLGVICGSVASSLLVFLRVRGRWLSLLPVYFAVFGPLWLWLYFVTQQREVVIGLATLGASVVAAAMAPSRRILAGAAILIAGVALDIYGSNIYL